MCPKNGSSLDLDPDPMDLMDLDLDLDPIHPSLTLIISEIIRYGFSHPSALAKASHCTLVSALRLLK